MAKDQDTLSKSVPKVTRTVNVRAFANQITIE